MADYLDVQLRGCTVQLKTSQEKVGSGFFVGPGLVLTCAHVVCGTHGNRPANVTVTWNGKILTGTVEKLLPEPCPEENIFPDISLIKVEFQDHPCVFLDPDFRINDNLYTFGYPKDRRYGDSVTTRCEGPAFYGEGDDFELMKVKEGQVWPGLSGAPILNLRTGGVCGIVKRTRGEQTDLGGFAVRTAVALHHFPDLEATQRQFHHDHPGWTQAKEAKRFLTPWWPKAVGALVTFLLVSWLLLEFGAFPWPLVQRFFHLHNWHLLFPTLDGVRELTYLPTTVLDYQKITVVHPQETDRMEVQESCMVRKGGQLIIRGPLTLAMAKGCGITSEGNLQIQGDSQSPVKFERLNEKEEWSNIELVGEGANGSALSHCTIQGGAAVLYSVPDMNISADAGNYRQQPLSRVGFSGDEKKNVRVGGAVILSDVSEISFTSCEFRDNRAFEGGALAMLSANDVKINDCRFIGNVAVGRLLSPGGAIYCANTTVTCRNCAFEDNRALDKFSCGGAIYAGFGSNVQLRKCTFTRNRCRYVGGALYALCLLPTYKGPDRSIFLEPQGSSIKVIDCEFSDDHANSVMLGTGKGGHELFIDGGYSGEINSCVFHNCSTYDPYLICVGSTDQDNPSSLFLKDSQLVYSTAPDSFNGPVDARSKPYKVGPKATLRGEENVTLIVEPFQRPKGVDGTVLDPMPPDCFKRGRDKGAKINTLVIHHSSALFWDKTDEQFTSAFRELFLRKHPELAKLTGSQRTFNPALCKAIFEAYKVSSHYLIDREGYISRLVSENDTAWHAGKSQMPTDGRGNVNQFSIGIELIATHPDDDPLVKNKKIPAYTEDQYEALKDLISSIRSRHLIRFIVGHDEIAPGRKKDPGPLFDWNRIRNPDFSPIN